MIARKKLFAILIIFILVAGSLFVIFAISRDKSGYNEISINDVLMKTSERNAQEEFVVISDSDPLLGVIATPISAWYDISGSNGSDDDGEGSAYGLKPLLVAEDGTLNNGQERFLSNVDISSAMVMGEVDQSASDDNIFTGSAEQISLGAAEKVFSEAAGAVITTNCQTGYTLGLAAAPLASYLNIPIIAKDEGTGFSKVKDTLDTLSADYLITVGPHAKDFARELGYDTVILKDADDINEAALTVIEHRFGELNYLTMTNPSDVIPPEVINSENDVFAVNVNNLKIRTGNTETDLVGESEHSQLLDVPDGINHISIYINFTELNAKPFDPMKDAVEVEPLIFASLYDPQNRLVAYAPSFSLDVGQTFIQTETFNLSGTYNLVTDVYYGTRGFDTYAGTEFGISNLEGTYEIDVTISTLSRPHLPLYPRMSIMSGYLAASHGGIVLADADFALTTDDYEIAADGYGTGPFYEKDLHDAANSKVGYIVEKLNTTMDSLIDHGLYEGYLNGPAWLGIVAGSNMLPNYYEAKDPTWVEDPIYGVGWATDNKYSHDLQLSNARVLGRDVGDLSALIARTMFFEEYTNGHSDMIKAEYGSTEDWGDNFHFLAGEMGGRTGWFFWQRNFAPEVEQHGFAAEEYYRDSENDRQTMIMKGAYERANYMDLMMHGNWYWYVPELNGLDSYSTGVKVSDIMKAPHDWELGPSTYVTGSCIMGRIDGVPAKQSLTFAFIHAGVNAFFSASRSTGSEAKAGTIERSLLYEDISVGEAMRKDKHINQEPAAFYVRILYGDPAFNPYEPENGFSDQGRPVLTAGLNQESISRSADQPVSQNSKSVSRSAGQPVSQNSKSVSQSAGQPVSQNSKSISRSAGQPVSQNSKSVSQSAGQPVSHDPSGERRDEDGGGRETRDVAGLGAVGVEEVARTFHDINENYDSYYTYEGISERLQELEMNNSDMMAVYSIGITHEGRDIWAVKLSDNPMESEDDEPEILFTGAHHGREWPSYTVAMYLLEYLVEYYSDKPYDNDGDGLVNEDWIDSIDNDDDGEVDEDESEARIKWLVDNRQIWIVPIVNPDGVAYSHYEVESGHTDENTLWRKNREPNKNPLTGEQYPENLGGNDMWGTDLNRNYGFHWGEVGYQGMGDPSREDYIGPIDKLDDDNDRRLNEDRMDGVDNDGDGKIDEDDRGGFSTMETRAIKKLVESHDYVITLNFHTYGDVIYWPWMWTLELPPDEDLYYHLAMGMSKYNGYGFRNMSERNQGTFSRHPPVDGDSNDWLYGKHGIMAYTIEIGTQFIAPEEEILDIVKKNLGSNLYMIEAADDMWGTRYGIEHEPLADTASSNGYTIKARITPPTVPPYGSASVPEIAGGGVKVCYTTDGNTYKVLKMEPSGENSEYMARIPEHSPGVIISYFIQVEDTNENIAQAPRYAPNDIYEFRVLSTRGEVSQSLLILHVIFIIGAIFFVIAAGLFAFRYLKTGRGFNRMLQLTGISTGMIFIGGFPLGFIVAYQVFGTPWTGVPFGWDITDNKTLVIFLFFAFSLFLVKGSIMSRFNAGRGRWCAFRWTLSALGLIRKRGIEGKRERGTAPAKDRISHGHFARLVIVGTLITVALYLIPHSLMVNPAVSIGLFLLLIAVFLIPSKTRSDAGVPLAASS